MGLHFKPRVEGILQDAWPVPLNWQSVRKAGKTQNLSHGGRHEEPLTKCSVVSGCDPGMERGRSWKNGSNTAQV